MAIRDDRKVIYNPYYELEPSCTRRHAPGDDERSNPAKRGRPTARSREVLPTFSEQVADQLGGVRGMVESSVPVLAFVLVNIIWSLTPALIVAVALALGIAAYRLLRKQSVRHAINGLFGIAIGALLAWKTGDAEGLLPAGHPAQRSATASP